MVTYSHTVVFIWEKKNLNKILFTNYMCVYCVYYYVLGVARYMYSHRTVTVTDFSVRCTRPYNEYRQFTPNPEGGARSNATQFDNRQQKNSECHELCTWKLSPLDSDHVLILNASLT